MIYYNYYPIISYAFYILRHLSILIMHLYDK